MAVASATQTLLGPLFRKLNSSRALTKRMWNASVSGMKSVWNGSVSATKRVWNASVWPRLIIFLLLPLLLGIAFAVGHHAFYASLDQTQVPTDDFSFKSIKTKIPRQQYNITVGSTFAFLVRSFLGIAVGVAYAQIFWKTILKQPHTVSAVDTMFTALSNAWDLVKVKIWWRRPLLLLLVLTAWLSPIQSVFTPATLYIHNVPVAPAKTALLPVAIGPEWRSPTFGDFTESFIQGTNASAILYDGPTYATKSAVTATSLIGFILPFTAPASNTSWTVTFDGPYLRCFHADAGMYEAILDNIYTSIVYGATRLTDPLPQAYDYLSWVPRGMEAADQLPFQSSTDLPTLSYRNDSTWDEAGNSTEASPFTLSSNTLGPLEPSQFILGPNETFGPFTMPATLYVSRFSPVFHTGKYSDYLSNATVIQCELRNSTYTVKFDFPNGFQALDTTISSNYTDVVAFSSVDADLTLEDTNITKDLNQPYWRRMAYQSVMDAFGSMFVGKIVDPYTALVGDYSNTSVQSTVIGRTTELQSLNMAVASSSAWSLQEGLEELFQNATLNLMTSQTFGTNLSSPQRPLTNVTFTEYHNIYVYSASKLWVAYGVAVGFSVLCVLAALATLVETRSYYSSTFSTVLRMAWFAHISVDIDPVGLNGREPLPEYISAADISFKEAGRDNEMD